MYDGAEERVKATLNGSTKVWFVCTNSRPATGQTFVSIIIHGSTLNRPRVSDLDLSQSPTVATYHDISNGEATKYITAEASSRLHDSSIISSNQAKQVNSFVGNYGRPLSVSGRPCYILPMFFYLFFFMAALFSGPGERRFAKVLHVVDLECH